MKSLGIVLSLMRFHLRLLPWYIWPLLAGILLLQGQITPVSLSQWTIGGYNTTRLLGPGFFSFLFLAGAFCGTRASYTGGPIPAGEFLLVRPVLRRTAYLSRMVLYFIIILAAPLLEVYVASAKPDLRIEFFDTSTQSPGAEAAARQKFYQDQFPESSVVHETKLVGTHTKIPYNALVIPSGALLIARWDLFAAIMIALILQIAMFFTSSKAQIGLLYGLASMFGTVIIIYFFASVAIAMTFPHYDNHTTLFEHGFFFFAHRGFLLTLFALEAFVLVQWIALKLIEKLEVL